jgi:hypothetical protein
MTAQSRSAIGVTMGGGNISSWWRHPFRNEFPTKRPPGIERWISRSAVAQPAPTQIEAVLMEVLSAQFVRCARAQSRECRFLCWGDGLAVLTSPVILIDIVYWNLNYNRHR